jgi:hypothetical protein
VIFTGALKRKSRPFALRQRRYIQYFAGQSNVKQPEHVKEYFASTVGIPKPLQFSEEVPGLPVS